MRNIFGRFFKRGLHEKSHAEAGSQDARKEEMHARAAGRKAENERGTSIDILARMVIQYDRKEATDPISLRSEIRVTTVSLKVQPGEFAQALERVGVKGTVKVKYMQTWAGIN